MQKGELHPWAAMVGMCTLNAVATSLCTNAKFTASSHTPLVPPFVGPALYLWPEQEARSRRSVAVPETLLVYPCTTGVLRPLP